MSEISPLERRYRRLLAWYPAEHRRAHGEEMIGVLLASASDGQQHPRLADSLDLIRGGLRIRLRAIRRRAPRCPGEPTLWPSTAWPSPRCWIIWHGRG